MAKSTKYRNKEELLARQRALLEEAQEDAGVQERVASLLDEVPEQPEMAQDPQADTEPEDSIDPEGSIEEEFAKQMTQLPPELADQLSEVLFPQAFTKTVTLLSEARAIHAIPILYAKKVYEACKPINVKLAKVASGDVKIEEAENDAFTGELVAALSTVATILAEFYEWEDVKEAIKKDGLSVPEIQELAVEQREANGRNDFLLGPLHGIIRSMQMFEMANLKLEGFLFQSMHALQRLQRSSESVSQISSELTQMASSPS